VNPLVTFRQATNRKPIRELPLSAVGDEIWCLSAWSEYHFHFDV